ncbi:MAG TPA: peptidylprolyl isomerase [Burkholderiales bacterium]|nr:peptidylprolyl isomerase [Burkholderiales bacterium]
MFHVVEKNKKLVKGIMIAVTATFIFFGIGSYLGMGSFNDNDYVAKIGSQKIYPRDIDNFTANTPQKLDKIKVMMGLIDRQLILNNIEDNHLTVTPKQIQDEIIKIPMFQDKNKIFSLTKYQDFLSSRTLTSDKFEQEIKKQILLKEFADFFKDSYFSSSLFQESFVTLLSKERNVSEYIINPNQFYSQIKVNESEIDAYYKQNITKYTLPEKVKVQYLELSLDNIISNIKPTESEINKYIAEHKAQAPETQVNASHILISIPKDVDSNKREQIKAKAQKILAIVKANPNNFKIYAKKYSQDPGSAANGGDLGFFGKGTMVKPFENEVFKMKPGQISNLVETQFGFHIIKLNSIKGNDQAYLRNFAITQIQKQKGLIQLQKMSEQLNDITYNNPSTLQPAATKLSLILQTSDWVNKGETQGIFSNSKIQNAIFSNDVIKKHNNSEVVDLGNNSYGVYRVIDYKQSTTEPLNIVKDKIINDIKGQKANAIAAEEGHTKLAQLKSGKINLNFVIGKNVSLLAETEGINSATVKQIFSTKTGKDFPAYTATINQQGSFIIYRINSESINSKLKQQNKQVLSQLENENSSDIFSEYIIFLKTKYPVDYKIDKLTNL